MMPPLLDVNRGYAAARINAENGPDVIDSVFQIVYAMGVSSQLKAG